jgi:hypothetical protein
MANRTNVTMRFITFKFFLRHFSLPFVLKTSEIPPQAAENKHGSDVESCGPDVNEFFTFKPDSDVWWRKTKVKI